VPAIFVRAGVYAGDEDRMAVRCQQRMNTRIWVHNRLETVSQPCWQSSQSFPDTKLDFRESLWVKGKGRRKINFWV